MEQGEEGSGQNFSPSPGQGAKANRRKGCWEERVVDAAGATILATSPEPQARLSPPPPPHPSGSSFTPSLLCDLEHETAVL